MAYTYKQGSDSSTWKPDGSTTNRKLQSRLYYQITDETTTYKIDAYGQGSLYKDNCGCGTEGKLSGAVSSDWQTKTYKYSSGGTNHTGKYYTLSPVRSITVNKTTATQVKTITFTFRRTAATGTKSVAEQTFYVPALPKYTVSFDVQGHGTKPANQSVFYGYNATTPTAPTATGYTFGGWFEDAACTTAFSFSAIKSNKTAYAKWTENSYSIAFNNGGGSGTMSTITHKYTDSFTLPANTFTKTDYRFIGWSTKTISEGGTVEYTNQQSVSHMIGSGTITLYAMWEYDYSAPALDARASRASDNQPNDTGTSQIIVYVDLIRGKRISTNATMNAQLKIEYKLTTASSYTTQTYTISSNLENQSYIYSLVIPVTAICEIRVTATTQDGSSVKTLANNVKELIVSTAQFIVDINEDGTALAIRDIAPNKGANTPGFYINTPVKIGTTNPRALTVYGGIYLELSNSAEDTALQNALDLLGWDVS